MSSYNKYITMGVSSLLLPLAKMIIQKLIGKTNKRIKVLKKDYQDEMARVSPEDFSKWG
jgi:hypothetical protein